LEATVAKAARKYVDEIDPLCSLGPRHTRHFCTQYCDKKIILSHRFLLAKARQALNKPQAKVLCVLLRAYLG